MTLQQLIDLCRIESFDNSTPPLFSDAELITWLNEAETEAAIRKQLLRENTSVALTQFDIVAANRSYPLDTRMYEIVYADLVPKGYTGIVRWPLGITTAAELDSYRGSSWRTVPFRPMSIIQYDSTIETDCPPNAAYTIRTEGYRLPMYPMGLNAVSEVLAAGTLTLIGASGLVNTVTVNGLDILGSAVTFITDLPTTATAVVAQINSNQNRYFASAVGAVITITDIVGTGSLHNGYAVAATMTTLTYTSTAFAGGVDAVVTRPEINAIHHRHLVKWALHRAYEKPDAETLNPDKSAKALAQFEAYFGERPNALNRKKQNSNNPHRNTAYS